MHTKTSRSRHARRTRRHTSPVVDVEPNDLVEAVADATELEPDEPAKARDTGELYGVHVPPADIELAPEDSATEGDPALGESWLEELRAKASETGAEPEHEIDVIDDTDETHPHHATESGDRPVADKGSGGIGGV
ncbi:MAG TPA: hypothetical protein VGF94_13065 [Kofleriaceae bacterium]|jgi:hypothetical protein